MSLFGRNPIESAYVDGKKYCVDIIKNSGSGDFLIWRHPEEEFTANSTLIVMLGEEAVFIKDGVIEQVFNNGTYELSIENYPFISRLCNVFMDGIRTFNCVVYFVRKMYNLEILWGTSSPIQVRDKLLGIATKLRARGAYKIQIDNSQKFLTKIIGNHISSQPQHELVDGFFANAFQSKIKSSITRALNETQTELLGIEARLDEFAEAVAPFFGEAFEDYGLKMTKFSIVALIVDDDELRRRYDEIGLDAIAKLRNAQADKSVMNVLGDDWGRQQAANILGNLAANQRSRETDTTGSGIGTHIVTDKTFESMAQQMFNPIQQQKPVPKTIQPSGKFTQKSTQSEIISDNPVSFTDHSVTLKKNEKKQDCEDMNKISNTIESENTSDKNDKYDLYKLAKTLRENEFEVEVFRTADAAVKFIVSRCAKKSIGLADSATIVRSGLLEALRTTNSNLLYASAISKSMHSRRKAATADVFILSANGISYETGEIVNVDSKGNRIAGSLFNPEEVIFVIGKNKIARNLNDAIYRARNVVAPRNAKEHGYDTPCVEKGKCEDCNHPDRICRVTCIFHKKPKLVNVMVVLIDENLGW